jgi:hypothetical protein
MNRRDLRTNEFEWHVVTADRTAPPAPQALQAPSARAKVLIGKPHPIKRANRLGRLVDRIAEFLK